MKNPASAGFFIIYNFELVYTATLCSLKASFKDVFKSVEALRFPIISAQGTW